MGNSAPWRIATGSMKLSIMTTAMVDHAINRMAALHNSERMFVFSAESLGSAAGQYDRTVPAIPLLPAVPPTNRSRPAPHRSGRVEQRTLNEKEPIRRFVVHAAGRAFRLKEIVYRSLDHHARIRPKCSSPIVAELFLDFVPGVDEKQAQFTGEENVASKIVDKTLDPASA